ncbi:MAG TPA: hypothetical protein VFT28_14230 [Gemmatimonadales bacterium]|nr:hypothetical protein [Gemmatimonadales bacterium]
MRSSKPLGAVALIGLLGCGDVIGPDELPECSAPVTLEVMPGETPTFSWTPRCRLSSLLVESDDGTDYWSILTRGENTLAPPVSYGGLPPGAETLAPPIPLTSSTTYRVAVARWTGPEDDDGQTLGAETFEP